MAFLRRFKRSPFWYAGFTDHDGERVQKSTKQSNRKKAQGVADAWEKAAKLGSEGRLGEAQARKVISDIYEAINGSALPSATARDFLKGWAERRKGDTKPGTARAYGQVARDFVESLGERADRDISQINRADVAKYRDAVLKRTTPATANKSLKYLRVALGAAYKDGLLQDNPAAKLDAIKRREGDSAKRRAFTLAELKKILKHADGEWRGLVLFGLYTGQRLKDIARLTWDSVDIEEQEIELVTGKTGRRMQLPMAAPLLTHLSSLPASDVPNAPLFPDAHAIAAKETGDSSLSQQFHGILVAAKMAKERTKDATGIGRSQRRAISEISFHSLRHTATSFLKSAGVSEAVAMDIIGHDSAAMSRHYTHIDLAAKRKALAKIPNVS